MLRQMAPALSGNARRFDKEIVWAVILTLLISPFAADYLSSVSMIEANRPSSNISSEVLAGQSDLSALPRVTMQSTGAPTFGANAPALTRISSQIERPAITLVVVGDMMLGRQVNIEMVKHDDFSWPFRQTIDLLESADLTLGNLESPIVSGCPFSGEGMVFCAVPRSAEGLAWAGIDATSLANNHAYTYSKLGFEQTVDYLQQAGIEPIPAGTLTVRQVGGIRIGILAFDDSNALLDVDQVAAAARESSHQVDILIGLMHWGIEYQAEPTERQREVGYALVDAGMDVIVGTHPHRIQPVEEYHGKLIAYSLGNFVFDQMWWEETRLGEVIRLTLVETSHGVTVSHEMIPIQIYDYGQPALTAQGR